MERRKWAAFGAVIGLAAMAVPGTARAGDHHDDPLRKIKHIVVIYEENHSFDNLYGTWEGVNGLRRAPASKTVQVDVTGKPLACLPQNDVNLKSPSPLATTCTGTDGSGIVLDSAFTNRPFKIDDYLSPTDVTCPPLSNPFGFGTGVPKGTTGARTGGCTRDLVHRFYQEQYQIDGGKMDRYTAGSDAVGLTQGYYDTRQLPIYQYLHGEDAPHYVIADRFFQAAFGGSFLNHQWLIAAASPTYPNAPAGLYSVLGADGSPANYKLHPTTGLVDGALTQKCTNASVNHLACGDYAVNTMQPSSIPFSSFGAKLPLQTGATIGDRLTDKGVDWAWYAGGWDDAVAGTPDPLFQYHHQPFNYYANYAQGTAGRTHLRDEKEFLDAAMNGTLKPVSFVKPIGEENEHPGYASEANGSDHLVKLIKAIENGPDGKSTMIVVTYDEFGGQWDHVSPPTADHGGVADQWGPGTRVPTLVISRQLPEDFAVDHVSHDTTSILATIEHKYGLAPLSSRDASVADLTSVFRADGEGGRGHDH